MKSALWGLFLYKMIKNLKKFKLGVDIFIFLVYNILALKSELQI